MSPSTRRAWIEIILSIITKYNLKGSPSTRRAWIEIQTSMTFRLTPSVALHPEGVDRNSKAH